MATLEHQGTGCPFVPAARCVVGRAPGTDLTLDELRVSGDHALIYWTYETWQVRDLGSRNGTWLGEHRLEPGEQLTLAVGDVVRFGGDAQRWQVLDLDPPPKKSSQPPLPPTIELETTAPSLDEISLRIAVSSDQEYIEVYVGHPTGERQVPPRAFHDLILVLALQRLSEQGLVSEAEEGWVYFDELCKMLGRSRQVVNVEVYRARQQLAELGIAKSVDLFERRATTRQIRLGVAFVAVMAL